MKKIELFILRSYTGPLMMTFFICVFILVMQGLWRYADDIVGKGLEIPVMAELLFYVALQVVPLALPLAILLAALMTFGNLGENYELTALKASGISLWRIMRPLFFVTVIISITAFWFNNNVLPVANLRFYTILSDIKSARPEMEIKEKVYYDGVDKFRIKIDHKNEKTGMLYDLIIHDHRDQINRNMNVTIADSGHMEIHESLGTINLTLYNGVTYDEKVSMNNGRLSERDRQMYRHDEFQQQCIQIRVDGLQNTTGSAEAYLAKNDRMKDLVRLRHDADSLISREDSLINNIRTQGLTANARRSRSYYKSDSAYSAAIDTSRTTLSIDSLARTLKPSQLRLAVSTAVRAAKSHKHSAEDQCRIIGEEHIKVNRHLMEQHRKFTMPIACLLFFFIGAPLGAIIRKGGLGLPLVISVLFFIFYYVIDTFGGKMARESVWPVANGMWMSTAILLAIGVFLTYKSATDSDLFRSEVYAKFFRHIMPTYFIKKTKRAIVVSKLRRKWNRTDLYAEYSVEELRDIKFTLDSKKVQFAEIIEREKAAEKAGENVDENELYQIMTEKLRSVSSSDSRLSRFIRTLFRLNKDE